MWPSFLCQHVAAAGSVASAAASVRESATADSVHRQSDEEPMFGTSRRSPVKTMAAEQIRNFVSAVQARGTRDPGADTNAAARSQSDQEAWRARGRILRLECRVGGASEGPEVFGGSCGASQQGGPSQCGRSAGRERCVVFASQCVEEIVQAIRHVPQKGVEQAVVFCVPQIKVPVPSVVRCFTSW